MVLSPLDQMVRDIQAQGYSRQEAERIVQQFFAAQPALSPLDQMVREIQAQGYTRPQAEQITQQFFAAQPVVSPTQPAISPLDQMVREIQAQGYTRPEAERITQEYFARQSQTVDQTGMPIQYGLDAMMQELEWATRLRMAEIDDATRRWIAELEDKLQRDLQEGRITHEQFMQERDLAQREAEFARTIAQQQAQFESDLQLRQLIADRSFAMEVARLAAAPADWIAYQNLVSAAQIPNVGLNLPGPASPEQMQRVASGFLGQNLPYNPSLGGAGQFGIRVPSPAQIPRSVAKAWSPTQVAMLTGLLRGGINVGGRQVSINPDDWFQQLQQSWIPSIPEQALGPVQYRF